MAKIGRNEPCPCGSGKKYKKCCLPVEELRARVAAEEARVAALEDERADLNAILSDEVLHLIEDGDLDEAERTAKELREEFPEDPIGLDRLARVAEARGNVRAAVDLYRQAVAQVDTDLEGDFCDHCRAEMVKAIRRLDPDGPSPPLEIDPV